VIDKSRNDRQDHHCIGAAEARIHHIGRGGDDDIEVSRHQRCIAGGPALKKIGSIDKPCFAKNPLSCATHRGVCDAVIAGINQIQGQNH
jgi:hypothetical protein